MSFSDDNDDFATREILFTSSMWSNVFAEPSTPSSFANVTDGNGNNINDSYAYNDTFSVQTREYIFDRITSLENSSLLFLFTIDLFNPLV